MSDSTSPMDVDMPIASDGVPHSSAPPKRRKIMEVFITTKPPARRKQIATKELPRKHSTAAASPLKARAAKAKASMANTALLARASRTRVKAATSSAAVVSTRVAYSHTISAAPTPRPSLLGVKGPKGPKGPSVSQAPPRRIVSSVFSL